MGHDFRSCNTQRHIDNFNPRTPCGARPLCRSLSGRRHSNFNPRAPCGARPCRPAWRASPKRFQSSCPVRGTTAKAHKNRFTAYTLLTKLAAKRVNNLRLDAFPKENAAFPPVRSTRSTPGRFPFAPESYYQHFLRIVGFLCSEMCDFRTVRIAQITPTRYVSFMRIPSGSRWRRQVIDAATRTRSSA